jgi:hypothetical protein
VFSVDQAAFDALDADLCRDSFGGACPDVTSLLSLGLPDGMANGPFPTQVPLPGGVGLLLGAAAVACAVGRRRPA